MHRTIIGAALAAVAVVTTACSGPPEDGRSISVSADDTSCTLSSPNGEAGRLTFEVDNKGGKVTEFYLYAEGDRVLGEVENIKAGTSKTLNVEVVAGKYTAACKPGMSGGGVRTPFTVNGEAPRRADIDAMLGAATRSYQRYVNSQAEALLARTEEFVTAVKAGRVDEAKALFPIARTYWKRVEPVAESFGDLDPRIDGREDIIAEGRPFTGFHRLEKDLWVSGARPDTSTIADTLLADVTEIVAKAKTVELTPLELANGAQELLNELATGKMTGEENRYSHTDLWDFRANVDGARTAIAALRPAVQSRDAALVSILDERFEAVDRVLEAHRVGDGFKPYTQLTPEDVRDLAVAVNALGEPLSRVAGVVAK